MSYVYYVEYSYYSDKMKVLVNNKPINKSSAILQYMNEPFFIWCSYMPELFFNELGESYEVIYVGRCEEAKILNELFKKNKYCTRFQYYSPPIDMTVQERLLNVDNLIVNNKLKDIIKIKRNIIFCGNDVIIDRYKNYIDELEVRNTFCEINFSTQKEISSYLSKNSIAVVLDNNLEKALNIALLYSNSNYVFVLLESNENGFIDVNRNIFIYGISKESFFNIVFECVLLFPLADCLKECCEKLLSLINNNYIKQKILDNLNINTVYSISADNMIEIGTSVPLRINYNGPKGNLPRFDFQYQIPGIVSCSQQRVYGECEGTTKVLFFENGSVEPIEELEFTVYRRNRITDILLSDKEIILGEGDRRKIGARYFPDNADNTDSITWYSENSEIVEVNSEGIINAKKSGTCKVFCSAERIFDSCMVVVKEYAQILNVDSSRIINGNLQMIPGEMLELGITVLPPNSFDSNIMMSSDNMLVANTIGKTINAVDYGNAKIVIENSSHRLRKELIVSVVKKIKKRKNGFK